MPKGAWNDGARLEAIMAENPQLLHTAIDTTDARALAEFSRQTPGTAVPAGR
jgi:hypothetical protein